MNIQLYLLLMLNLHMICCVEIHVIVEGAASDVSNGQDEKCSALEVVFHLNCSCHRNDDKTQAWNINMTLKFNFLDFLGNRLRSDFNRSITNNDHDLGGVLETINKNVVSNGDFYSKVWGDVNMSHDAKAGHVGRLDSRDATKEFTFSIHDTLEITTLSVNVETWSDAIDTMSGVRTKDENSMIIENEGINISNCLTYDLLRLQCFGCNGELLPNYLMDKRHTAAFSATVSFTAGMFELVQSTDVTLAEWTRSNCEHRGSLCTYCQKTNWFVYRADGVCRRLYIYDIAMTIDDISIDFDDMNKMSHYMIWFLKDNFGYDVLEEWWPALVGFDGRLTSHLYVARFLVYDVHHASVSDAINQIHQLSLMTYMLRHHCLNRLLEANETININTISMKSFDLKERMRTILELYNLTSQTNRSTCVCKVVLGEALQSRFMDDVKNHCSSACFPESFYQVDIKLEDHLNDCFKRYNTFTVNSFGHLVKSLWLFDIIIINMSVWLK